MTTRAENIGYGNMSVSDANSEFNRTAFIVRQMMIRLNTMKPVVVKAVHAGAADLDAPTVDVQPLTNQLDGNNNATPHGTIFGIPVFRIQAGTTAIIIDPKVGDVGMLLCADRDISSLKASTDRTKPTNPGSRRMMSLSDGIYIGGILNATPETYIRLQGDGHLKIVTADGLVLETSASGFEITGNVAVTGNITATGSITAGSGSGDQVGLQSHVHTSGGSGAPTSAPTPGT